MENGAKILEELHEIKNDLRFIKAEMVDKDQFLSEEERILLDKARQEYKEGGILSLQDIESEMNVST